MIAFKKIVICGVGLIGGSVALALRKAGYSGRVVGLERNSDVLVRAHKLGILDDAGSSLGETFKDADLLMLAVPVAQTAKVLESFLPYLPDNIVITDTGSTKSDVVAMARNVLGDRVARFVPAHPIAGSESNGPEAAFATLFEGKKTVIAQLPENSETDVAQVAALWETCGAIIHYLTPAGHDRVFATVSHLPHLLAYGLVDYVANHPLSELFFQYAASGFRDFTRIAESSPEMWRDISLANRTHLLEGLDAYMEELFRMRALLADSNGAGLDAIFANARQARMNWRCAIESVETGNKNK